MYLWTRAWRENLGKVDMVEKRRCSIRFTYICGPRKCENLVVVKRRFSSQEIATKSISNQAVCEQLESPSNVALRNQLTLISFQLWGSSTFLFYTYVQFSSRLKFVVVMILHAGKHCKWQLISMQIFMNNVSDILIWNVLTHLLNIIVEFKLEEFYLLETIKTILCISAFLNFP